MSRWAAGRTHPSIDTRLVREAAGISKPASYILLYEQIAPGYREPELVTMSPGRAESNDTTPE